MLLRFGNPRHFLRQPTCFPLRSIVLILRGLELRPAIRRVFEAVSREAILPQGILLRRFFGVKAAVVDTSRHESLRRSGG